MWDLDYIKRQSGASKVVQLGDDAVGCRPPGGGDQVIVSARRVDGGGWMLFARGDGLCNPAPTIKAAVESIGNWRRIFIATR